MLEADALAALQAEVASLRTEVAALRADLTAPSAVPRARPEITDGDLGDLGRVARIGVDRVFETGDFGGDRAEATRLSNVLRKLAKLPSAAGLRVVVLPRRHGRRRFLLRDATMAQSGAPHCAPQPDELSV